MFVLQESSPGLESCTLPLPLRIYSLPMVTSDTKATTTNNFHHHSSSSSPSSSPTSSRPAPPAPSHPRSVVLSPCAACKILRRRCDDNCLLAPYFPPTEPLKFTTAHRVFGASNIIKFLRELPESQRADAVSSMVYEANARIGDPVYGCAGVISVLQKQVSELQAQLAQAQAELVHVNTQHANLLALVSMGTAQSQQQYMPQLFDESAGSDARCFPDDSIQVSLWEPLWT